MRFVVDDFAVISQSECMSPMVSLARLPIPGSAWSSRDPLSLGLSLISLSLTVRLSACLRAPSFQRFWTSSKKKKEKCILCWCACALVWLRGLAEQASQLLSGCVQLEAVAQVARSRTDSH